jgi:hypothetical protein
MTVTADDLDGAYAGQLAVRPAARYVRFLASADADASPAEVLEFAEAGGRILAATVRTAPRQARAYHPTGMADPEGFAAMGCVEEDRREHIGEAGEGSCRVGQLHAAGDHPVTLTVPRLRAQLPEGPPAPVRADPDADLMITGGSPEPGLEFRQPGRRRVGRKAQQRLRGPIVTYRAGAPATGRLPGSACSCVSLPAGRDRRGEADAGLRAELAESQGAGDAPGDLGPCPPLRQPALPDRVGDRR